MYVRIVLIWHLLFCYHAFQYELIYVSIDLIILINHLTIFFQEEEEAEWRTIKPEAFAIIMDFFASGLPVIHADGQADNEHGRFGAILY